MLVAAAAAVVAHLKEMHTPAIAGQPAGQQQPDCALNASFAAAVGASAFGAASAGRAAAVGAASHLCLPSGDQLWICVGHVDLVAQRLQTADLCAPANAPLAFDGPADDDDEGGDADGVYG